MLDEYELSQLLKNKIPDYHFEKRIVKKDGSISWVHITRSLIKLQNNRTIIFSIIEDINIKKRSADILNQSFENYKLLAENSPDIIIRFDKNLNFIYVNPPIEKINGHKPDSLIGRNLTEISHPEQFKSWNDRFKNIIKLKEKKYFQDILHTIDGERTVETIFVPEFDDCGDVSFILTISRDITERIESQREIERKNILLEKILGNIPVGVWIVDELGNMTMHNKASEEIWGGTENISIRKQPEFKGWWAESGERIKLDEWASYNAFKYGKTYLNQIINIESFDGKRKTIMNSAIPMFDKNEKIIGVVVVNQDVSRFIQIENELKASLEEKEMLMKEIHHRVKNNFQVVSSLLNLQRSSLKNQNVEEVLLECQNRIKSMAILHEKLYRSGDLIRINLNGYLTDLLKSLHNSYRLKERNINIELNMDEIYVSTDDAINLGLIINELVVNSLKHAFKGRKEGLITISLKENDSSNLEIIVKDDGIGISENINIEKTDSLGLLLINSFVKQVKGKIKLIRGQGTEFRIVSPKMPGSMKSPTRSF